MERERPKVIEKSQAARLYIDSYYKNLFEKGEERQRRRVNLKNETASLSPEQAKVKELALSQAESENLRLTRHKVSTKDFINIRLIGRGAFGEVRVVRKKLWPGEEGPQKIYAMKIMNKDFMIQKNQLAHARAERDAMVEHDDPGIVKMYFSFQDSRFLYFVMEYLPGGDLMNLLIKREILSEDETRFYMAELIQAVQTVHKRGYIHRDLKPDNILIGSDGHIKLSDFGLCTSGAESHISSFYNPYVPKNYNKHTAKPAKGGHERRTSWNRKRKTMSYSTVGTSNYMAPEILLEQGYGPEIDWWSVGVILYECIVGYAPFSCEDTTETCIMILEFQTSLEFPEEPQISPEARHLIQKCLLVEQLDRKGYDDIVSHPWFKGMDFDSVRNQKAPWIPDLNNDDDTTNFDDFEDDNADFFFGDDYSESFEDPTSKPLKDWDDKHLAFVGWTYKRFEPKARPTAASVFSQSTDRENVEVEKKKDQKRRSKLIGGWGKPKEKKKN